MHRRQFMQGIGVALGATLSMPAMPVAPAATKALQGQRLDAVALEDALVGSSYLGCGGGGTLAAARDLVASDLAAGLSYRLLDVAKLGDDDWVASPYALESLAPMDPAMQARLDAMGPGVDVPVNASFRLLEDYLGKKFSAVIVGVETGQSEARRQR